MEIIDLAQARRDREDIIRGNALCVACNHKWEATAPVGTVWLECPECTAVRARFIQPIERYGMHWICACGCDLFHATTEGYYCPNCGEWQKPK